MVAGLVSAKILLKTERSRCITLTGLSGTTAWVQESNRAAGYCVGGAVVAETVDIKVRQTVVPA